MRLLHLLKEFRREQTKELPNRGLMLYTTSGVSGRLLVAGGTGDFGIGVQCGPKGRGDESAGTSHKGVYGVGEGAYMEEI